MRVDGTAMSRLVAEPHKVLRVVGGWPCIFPRTVSGGLDKFFHVLVNWDQYLSPIAQRVLGGYSHPFMLLAGVVEMIVGLMVITRWPRLGAYIASIWLLLIAINLLTTGQYFDIALRDIGLCLSAFGLAKLSEAPAAARVRAPIEMPRAA